MTITIAGKTLEWPEKCRAFVIDGHKWFCWYGPGYREQVSIILDDETRSWIVADRDCWIPIIACVAAQHFRNKVVTIAAEIESEEYSMSAFNDADWAKHSKLCADKLRCENAADAWAELAKV